MSRSYISLLVCGFLLCTPAVNVGKSHIRRVAVSSNGSLLHGNSQSDYRSDASKREKGHVASVETSPHAHRRAESPLTSIDPPDYRAQACTSASQDQPEGLPTATLVIPYLMEEWHRISNFVKSLVKTTNMELIDDVRFVDDGNPDDHKFARQLRELHPKVSVISNKKRVGLIRSKVIGAAGAKSPILIFLEPHCVFGHSWLEPLLKHMNKSSESTVTMPALDVIHGDYLPDTPANELYSSGAILPGVFNIATMNFLWSDPNSASAKTTPFPTPAMPGGIFAMWRSFWESSGAYDAEMTEWGGENIEMSVRVWTCGGRIEIVPCSHIFHWFRKSRPYVFHGEAFRRNSKRAALVWLDSYASLAMPTDSTYQKLDAGDLSSRVALRRQLGCKPFQWYIDHVDPEILNRTDA